jgi:uncharacterized RDD family membrane protein YckC
MTANPEQIDWGHWIFRLIAFIIDGILLAIVAGIIGFILAIAAIFGGGFFFYFGALGFFAFSFLWGILSFLYFMFLDTYWGATIGKRIMGFQVQTTTGGRIPLGKSFIRNISKILWLFLLLDWIIGVATPGDKRQKYMDRIAGAIVVQTRQSTFATAPSTAPPPPPPPPPT